MLEGLAPWDWFGTYTFSDLITPPGARYWFQRYLTLVEDAVNGWKYPPPSRRNGWGYVDDQRSLPRSRVHAFRGDEYGPRGGRLHIHALIGNVAGLRRYCDQRLPAGEWGKKCCMLHAWPCGHARVLRYDPKKGASYYVAKYCIKSLGDWELYGFPLS